jgi:4-hydroxy-3-methylbut-2-enyl diphosphate reductase
VVFAMSGRLADPVTGRVPQTPLAGELTPAPEGVR